MSSQPAEPTSIPWRPTAIWPLFYAFIARAQPMLFGVVFILMAVKKTPVVEFGQYTALLSAYSFLQIIVRTTFFIPFVRTRVKKDPVLGAEAGAFIVAMTVITTVAIVGSSIMYFAVAGTDWAGIQPLLRIFIVMCIISTVRDFYILIMMAERDTMRMAITDGVFFLGMITGLISFDHLELAGLHLTYC